MQEHHDRTRETAPLETKSENPDADSDTSILAQIVETQHEIQTSHLDLASTANLVVQRILKITGAQGAALGILEDEHLVYHAGRGILARQVGQSMRPEATLSSSTLTHGLILRCTDAGQRDSDARQDGTILCLGFTEDVACLSLTKCAKSEK